MKRVCKKAIIILLIVGFFGIPLLFLASFHGDEKSVGLGFILSDLSVSDWFSFWIAFLVGYGALIIAIKALNLSLAIEQKASEERRNNERIMFVPSRVILQATKDNGSYEFVIYLQQGVVLLKNLQCVINSAYYGNKKIPMCVENNLETLTPHVIISVDSKSSNINEFNNLVDKWQDESSGHSEDNYKFVLKLKFSYSASDYRGMSHTYYLQMLLNSIYVSDDNIIVLNPTILFASCLSNTNEGRL